MANFPPSPSLGELFTINNMTYRFNESGAWEVVITQSDESLVDVGVSTFESQVQFNDTSGTQVLYHFNDNLTDNGPNSITATSANLTYGTGKFGKAAQFNGATDGTNTHVDFTGGGNDIGTGPYTIEFWANVTEFDYGTISNNVNGRAEFINSHSDQSTQAGPGYYKIGTYGGSLYISHHDGTAWTQIIGTHGMSVGTWYHIAVSRDSGGTTRVFIGTTGTNTLIATHTGPAISIGDGGHAWTLGRTMNNTAGHGSWGNYHLDGLIDELLITKTAKYTSTFTVPTAPHDDIVTKPPAVAGKALLYAKDVTGGTAAEVIFHLDDNFDNAGSGGNATAAGPPSFQVSTVTGTGFGKQINFNNTAGVGTTPSDYLTFPDPTIGTGPFTFECWFNSDVATSVQTLFSDGGSTGIPGSAYGDVTFHTIIDQYTNNVNGFGLYQAHAAGLWEYIRWGTTATGNLWTPGSGMKHIALVRGAADAVSAGHSQWKLYFNGNYIAPNTLQNTDMGNLPTVDMGGQDHQIGRTIYDGRAFDGQMDEIRITKSDTLYRGTGSYTIPTAPFALPFSGSKLHVMDSTGSEGVIS
mgnify:CR=1 FL=1